MPAPLDHALGLLQKAESDLIAAHAVLDTGQALATAEDVYQLAEGLLR